MSGKIHFFKNLSPMAMAKFAPPASTIVIFDRNLLKYIPGFRKWLNHYPHTFAVSSGEQLKNLESFQNICERIHRDVGGLANQSWTVLSVGGGSVGDFAGFFASVYKRGLTLVHMPTTWLAAIDSSHGGKTALNLLGAKNQIGSFYPAKYTFLVREILYALPLASIDDAVGELAKIILVSKKSWPIKMSRPASTRQLQAQWLWRCLPFAIKAKKRIVRLDPDESKGLRQILNFGHTFGHVIESALGYTHGRSVGLGLMFALEFSEASGAISSRRAIAIRDWLASMGISRDVNKVLPISVNVARKLLLLDKKRDARGTVWFIVIKSFGSVERRLVPVDQILAVAKYRGWVR